MDLELKNRRVLVTGSSRGVGQGIATAFLAEGARIVVTGRDRLRLRKQAAEWKKKFGSERVLACPGDLTNVEDMGKVLGQVKNAWQGLDVLVLNLGSGRSVPGLTADSAEWYRVLNLNLIAAMEMLRLGVGLLAGGRNPTVVFIGSIAGMEALGAPIAYGAAKAGLQHAMKSAAQHLASSGIRANMVAPGNILFPDGTWDKKTKDAPEATAAMLRTQVPLGRFGTVDEVAAAVLFMASSRAAFITGACLAVDGGQTRA